MANIFDTARYILEKLGSIPPMRLQRLCYYSQAWSLGWNNELLFEEDFEMWSSGPVCSELYHKTTGKILVNAIDTDGGEGNLSSKQKNTINRVLEYYRKYDSPQLGRMLQLEGPCVDAERDSDGTGTDLTQNVTKTFEKSQKK
jgi:uncharacterized phage-associated protein